MTYYDDLTKDKERVHAFYQAIDEKVHGTVYDLGTGSGILAIKASEKADKVIALENNPLIIKTTQETFNNYENITLVECDASKYKTEISPDVIICEMLDTALIDEEEVPVLNNMHKYANKNTIYIPKAVYSTIELISTKISIVTYYEDNHPNYESLSKEKTYSNIDLTKDVTPELDTDISIKTNKNGLLNAVKITTYTIITDEIILKPTPMLNPSLLIPLEESTVNKDEEIIINLKYTMGGGLNTIQATRK